MMNNSCLCKNRTPSHTSTVIGSPRTMCVYYLEDELCYRKVHREVFRCNFVLSEGFSTSLFFSESFHERAVAWRVSSQKHSSEYATLCRRFWETVFRGFEKLLLLGRSQHNCLELGLHAHLEFYFHLFMPIRFHCARGVSFPLINCYLCSQLFFSVFVC